MLLPMNNVNMSCMVEIETCSTQHFLFLGFVEELTPAHSKSNGKASSGSLKTGGKGSSFSKGMHAQCYYT